MAADRRPLGPTRRQHVTRPPQGEDEQRPHREGQAEAAQAGRAHRELRAGRDDLVADRREERRW